MSDHGAKAVRRTLVGAAAHLRGARPRRWWSIVALAVALGGWFVSGAPAAGPGGWDHLGDGGLPGSDSLDGAVYALDPAAPGALYVGGAFTSAGGYSGAAHIARWDGTGWSPVGSPALTGDVHAIAYDAG